MYDEKLMRQHLLYLLENRNLSPFSLVTESDSFQQSGLLDLCREKDARNEKLDDYIKLNEKKENKKVSNFFYETSLESEKADDCQMMNNIIEENKSYESSCDHNNDTRKRKISNSSVEKAFKQKHKRYDVELEIESKNKQALYNQKYYTTNKQKILEQRKYLYQKQKQEISLITNSYLKLNKNSENSQVSYLSKVISSESEGFSDCKPERLEKISDHLKNKILTNASEKVEKNSLMSYFKVKEFSENFIDKLSSKIGFSTKAQCRNEAEKIIKWCLIGRKNNYCSLKRSLETLKNQANANIIKYDTCTSKTKSEIKEKLTILCGSSKHKLLKNLIQQILLMNLEKQCIIKPKILYNMN